jgi:hypothetical protein
MLPRPRDPPGRLGGFFYAYCRAGGAPCFADTALTWRAGVFSFPTAMGKVRYVAVTDDERNLAAFGSLGDGDIGRPRPLQVERFPVAALVAAEIPDHRRRRA